MCHTVYGQTSKEFWRSYHIDNIKSPEICLTYICLRIDNNVYTLYMSSIVVGTCMCPVCYRSEDTIKHLLFSCQHFDKQRMEIDDKPHWPSFDISTKFKLLLDIQCPNYLFQTCCTYVHELYSEREKHIWLFQMLKPEYNKAQLTRLLCTQMILVIYE